MAAAPEKKAKPRVRKSAPTVRERVEASRSKAEAKKPRLIKRAISRPADAIKGSRLSQSRAAKIAKKPFSLIKKALRWIIPRYFINSWRELRLVHWPSRRETWRLTLAVFIFAIVFGALVAGVDKSLDEIFKKVVLK
ncbi:MAG TPA: preprotein translocase subunit SecE [Candidatus Babeliales bacterium]|nr:preprotein translocase subunit SecE [Candidatus Babeliales bacterium]